MTYNRLSKNDYYLSIAEAVLARSTCLRRKYGAVIVKDDEIIATGYNGAARGAKNCCDIGYCQREQEHIPHGERYEKCRAIHAEANAIISASRRDMLGATLYLAGFEADGSPVEDIAPCSMLHMSKAYPQRWNSFYSYARRWRPTSNKGDKE